MFQRLLWFVFLLAIAVLIGILGPNTYKTIECNNADKICKVYDINSVLNTKFFKKAVNVSSGRGQSWYVMGAGQNKVKNLSCYSQSYTITRRDGITENRVKYLLASVNKPNSTTFDTLNEYTSNTSCEVDRLAIQTYLSSNSTDTFVYIVSGSWFRYLWYLVSALFVIISFLALFKGQVLSVTEENQPKNTVSEADFKRMHDGIGNIIKQISDIDKSGADNIKEIEKRYDKYRIDIHNDEN